MITKNIALIGSGATALYFLKHLADNVYNLKCSVEEIAVFEKGIYMGMGMPYNPETTDRYNLANISSEEIPELPESFGDWLRKQDIETLNAYNIKVFPIDDAEVYSRIALGAYFQEQYKVLIKRLTKKGIQVNQIQEETVKDIVFNEEHKSWIIKTQKLDFLNFHKVIIATGHQWEQKDIVAINYFSSPWPIHKLLPQKGTYYTKPIGILGASLSAFDVVTSLSHRHGTFQNRNGELTFKLNPQAKGFKILLHASSGWLPHLQYEQEYPKREIYRHTTRKKLLTLRDRNGFLNIDTFFDKVCRPALIRALKKDKLLELAKNLEVDQTGFKDFIQCMSDLHEYTDSFEGMRKERVAARKSIEEKKPIHWKETLDDLMYCLNFHAELLSAEDHLFFKLEVMSFLMNVIAALPLSSANILLALYDAGCIDLISGKVTRIDPNAKKQITVLKVEKEDGTAETYAYTMFVDCTGQKNLEISQFPFPALVKNGKVRKARAAFVNDECVKELSCKVDKDLIFKENTISYLYTGGVDIDAGYRLVAANGNPNDSIYDISFTHTSGCRPYSYGLQACDATSKILIELWRSTTLENSKDPIEIEEISKIYDEENI
ncbi:FAD-NAD(P)-binding protein [Leeuwenhoekiella aestuarii]|uniref:FAD-NAD(P)-binding protein n=1 Tax=Leeuwenhoekiella aestuarii TaxID=2249426 RepID=A0A4Q0NP81_9FLAO|nr:FAD/NAD(P)-binding protein [Leeuwenhoekiella aestuarii]RXG11207.1 FAD-NAD(P)-binding protein [Leeuwenhoekiella aestuarii]RXG11573.1 FAD-NAD(P)-binding protein [Leeuwenhoekiella aestuarii]